MNKEQKSMLIQLLIITDKYGLLRDDDQSLEAYEKDKKDAYDVLVNFIMKKGK